MARTMRDTAFHRAPRPPRSNSLHIPPRIFQPKPRSRSFNCLGRALLNLRRQVVTFVEPFFFHVALLLLFCFLPKLMFSLLLVSLNFIQSVLLRKLHSVFLFILLISFIGLLGFLFDIISLSNTSTRAEEHPHAVTSRRKRQEKKKKEQEEEEEEDLISNFFSPCTDAATDHEIIPDFTTLLSRLLFKSSADEYSVDDSFSSPLSAAEDQSFEEDEYLAEKPQAASQEEEEEEEEEAFSAASTSYYRTPLSINESAASTNDTKSISLVKTNAYLHNKHIRSRGYSFGLNLHDSVPSTASSTVYAAEPSMVSRHRRANCVSCDWDSTESYLPCLRSANPGLYSLPLCPPSGFNSRKSSSETALSLHSQPPSWKFSSQISTAPCKQKSYDVRVAELLKPPDIINYGEVFSRTVRSNRDDQLHW